MNTYTLHLGDCLEYMRGMEAGSVDAVVTDPPYGVDYDYKSYSDTLENLQNLIPIFITESKRVSGRMAIFTGTKNLSLYPETQWTYAWVVPNGAGVSSHGFTCWTPIVYYGKDAYAGKGSRPDVFVDYKPKREGVDHPCEKPLSVMLWAIERFSLEGDTIFDPFMGSGTTGVACMKLGRNFIGCEIDPNYFKIAERRIEQAARQISLFTEEQ